MNQEHPRYIQTKPHKPGCRALENVKAGQWDTPWWSPGEVRRLDALGRRTRYAFGPRRWIVLRCNTVNNPDLPGGCCEGEMLFREEYMLTEAPHGVTDPPEQGPLPEDHSPADPPEES